MRLRQLRDIYQGQDLYIVGSGPTVNLFPFDFLRDKVCLSLNDSYKLHPAISPVALMHHETYSRAGKRLTDPFHPNFSRIKFPIVKASAGLRLPDSLIDWDHPHFYFYDWTHDLENLHGLRKDTDYLYYTPEGCSLHAALQIGWIMGAKTIFVIGCDSRTMGGKHYANYDKSGFRDEEIITTGVNRNYDSYVYGTLIVQEFLERQGVSVINLSPIVSYSGIDDQFESLSERIR